jgi:WD repeat-containing protein 61
LNIFTTENGKKIQSLDVQKKTFIMSVAYVKKNYILKKKKSNCGKYIACGGNEGNIYVFNVSTSKILYNLQGHSSTVRSLKFTNDSQKLITTSDDKHIHVYDMSTGNLVKSLSGHSSFVLSVAVSPDNEHFSTTSTDKTVKIWELSSLDCINTFSEHNDQGFFFFYLKKLVWSSSFNFDGSLLCSVSDDLLMKIYNCPLDNSK